MNPAPASRLDISALRHQLTHLLDARNQTLLQGLIFLFGFLFFGVVSVWLGQDNNWDLRNYHFYNPYAYLEGRLAFDYAPAQLQTFLNPTGDLLFYFFVIHLKPIWVGFFMGSIQGLNFGLVFVIAHQLFETLTAKTRVGLAVLVAAVGLYGPVFIAELGASQNDSLTSLFVLASILILIRRVVPVPHARSARGAKCAHSGGCPAWIGGRLKTHGADLCHRRHLGPALHQGKLEKPIGYGDGLGCGW